MSGRTAAVLLSVAVALLPTESFTQVVIPKPEEACHACTVVNVSQRTRWPDDTFEEWYVGCAGCRGLYAQWTLQATFECFPWDLRERSRNPGQGREYRIAERLCSDRDCEDLEFIALCSTRNPFTGKTSGSVETSCACCLGCRECLTESRPPRAGLPPPTELSHGQRVGITVGGTDPDGDIVTVFVRAPAYGRLTWHSEPKGDGYAMWVDATYEPPDPCWTGGDWFDFVVCDAHGNTARGRVEIKVVNREPQVRENVKWITVVAFEPHSIRLPEASDPDPGDQEALQYRILLDRLPSEAGTWTGVPPLLTLVAQPRCLPIVLPWEARDPCGKRSGGIVNLRVLHRPVVRAPAGPISVCCGRSDALSVYVDDFDFLCGTIELVLGEQITQYIEKLRLSVASASRSYITIAPEVATKGSTCTVTYTPNPGIRQDELIITAVDEAQLGTIVRVSLTVDRPPSPMEVPSVVEARPGKTVRVSLRSLGGCVESVTMRHTAGPGELVGNTYTWIVESPYWGPSWRLVGFVLEDRCGGRTHQYFHVRVLQPPVVSDASVTVRPCREVTEVRASTWVVDPDTPIDQLTGHGDNISLPPGLSAALVGLRRQPWGSYYGHLGVAELVVRVAPWARPGVYEVPVSVTDPDGGSSSARLRVTVVENRPPQARPSSLEGAIRAEITGPREVDYTPGALSWGPISITDPEGDTVVVRGLEPLSGFAFQASFAMGSLWVMYEPQVAVRDLCAAVREGAIQHQFNVVLEDRCGGQTDLPVTVRIDVVDRVPPAITTPAQNLTVECDGQGNTAQLSSWLAIQGGAWARRTLDWGGTLECGRRG